MAREVKVRCMMLFLLTITLNLKNLAKGEAKVPCYFIFGDSLADSGNNNDLVTLAKAINPPYGIDFPTGCTGRFCNGRTTFDVIGELLGFTSFIPPFPKAWTSDIFKGVNYASGSGGILEETGRDLGENIPMKKQLTRHGLIVSYIKSRLGNTESASSYLKKCFYAVNIGSNDYIQNYFLPFYPSSRLYTPKQFAELLIQHFSPQIKSLYNMGARKVALVGLGPLGCTPNAIATYPRNGTRCVENMNNAANLFNERLISLVDKFNNDHLDAQFIFINAFGIISGDAAAKGFKVIDAPCCKTVGNLSCIPFGSACKNRNEYRYWDEFHPTEATNRFVAKRAFHAAHPSDAYPFDISHLIDM